MPILGRFATALTAIIALSGCASMVTTVTSYDVQFPTGVPSEFNYAAVGGEMPVVVVGNPFSAPQSDVDAAVISAMQGKTFTAKVRFVPAEGDARTSGYAVVMLLDATGGAGGNTACAWRSRLASRTGTAMPSGAPQPAADPRPAPGSGPMTGPMTLLAAFCGNADARSWAYSTTGPVDSPYSAHFRELVALTTMSMLPPRDDDYNNSNDFD